jgi:outer membrane immunogenic protein
MKIIAFAAFASVFAASTFAVPALGADMALKAPPPAPLVSSWTGFYVGLNGGYGRNDPTGSSYCVTPGGIMNGGGCLGLDPAAAKPEGGLFGGQIGYNVQSGQFVYGLETDIQWSGIKGTGTGIATCCNPRPVPAGVYTASDKLDWFGTARFRLGLVVGIVVGTNGLVYATGGLIYGRESVSNSDILTGASYQANGSTTRGGGIAGGGFEYTFTGSVSGKIEGLYYDMGSITDSFTNTGNLYTEVYKSKFKGEIFRAGLNWKLGAPFVSKN